MRALFSDVQSAPPDPILGLSVDFKADPTPRKQNLGPGVYMDERGLTPVLEVVQAASERLHGRAEGYLPIEGLDNFISGATALVLGEDSPALRAGSIAAAQAIGGTGALSLGAHLLRRFFPGINAVISDPSWPNHRGIFGEVGCRIETYPYFDAPTNSVKFDEIMSKLHAVKDRAAVVLHANCHNPTGADFVPSEWNSLADFFENSPHVPVIDLAYQGFKESLALDAGPARLFVERGIPCLIATSMSKNFSLYSQRVGALIVNTGSKQEASSVMTQIRSCIRTLWSNPPSYGASLVGEVLHDAGLRARWETELAAMRMRMQSMRERFVHGMKERGLNFSHVLNQYGMFSYTGLTSAEADQLKKRFGIYIVGTGRISIPALNPGNIDYVCDAVASVRSASAN